MVPFAIAIADSSFRVDEHFVLSTAMHFNQFSQKKNKKKTISQMALVAFPLSLHFAFQLFLLCSISPLIVVRESSVTQSVFFPKTSVVGSTFCFVYNSTVRRSVEQTSMTEFFCKNKKRKTKFNSTRKCSIGKFLCW